MSPSTESWIKPKTHPIDQPIKTPKKNFQKLMQSVNKSINKTTSYHIKSVMWIQIHVIYQIKSNLTTITLIRLTKQNKIASKQTISYIQRKHQPTKPKKNKLQSSKTQHLECKSRFYIYVSQFQSLTKMDHVASAFFLKLRPQTISNNTIVIQ